MKKIEKKIILAALICLGAGFTPVIYPNSEETPQGLWSALGQLKEAVKSAFIWSTETVNKALPQDDGTINKKILEVSQYRDQVKKEMEEILPYVGSNLDRQLLDTGFKETLNDYLKTQELDSTTGYKDVFSKASQKISDTLAPDRETYTKNHVELEAINKTIKAAQPSLTARAFNWLSFGAIFPAGFYAGNFLYKKYCEKYFNRAMTREEIETQLNQVQIDLAALHLQSPESKEIQTKIETKMAQEQALQKSLENLSFEPHNPPSRWKKLGGIITRVGLMAATTGLLYLAHKKTIGAWCSQPNSTVDILALQRLQEPLAAFNKTFLAKEKTAKTIQDFNTRLRPDNPSHSDDVAKALVGSYANLVNAENDLKKLKVIRESTAVDEKTGWLDIWLKLANQSLQA